MFPDYVTYLQIAVHEEENGNEPRNREVFFLPVVINGVPVHNQQVILSVSTISGQIIAYSGISYHMLCRVAELPFHPVITADKALEQYAAHVTLQKRWFHHSDHDRYQLIYEPTTLQSVDKRKLRYIDARSGERIWERI